MSDATPHHPPEFLPKLLTVLREGYGWRDLRADAMAGLAVAIVALPLSMAIAIASGVGPERGLITAIVGGFLISALGGSRFQIGGPAGAFIVSVSACVASIGVDGLLLATFMSGFLLVVAGFLRVGSYIKFIPYPVTVGFTAGIGLIIFISQIRELFGLTLTGAEPAAVVDKLAVLWQARDTVNLQALAVAAATILLISLLKRYKPQWPSLLIGIVVITLANEVAGLDVVTVGDRFGDLPSTLPAPSLPVFSTEKVMAALPFALSFTLLGAITALLSAVVADGVSGARHRSAIELVAQGVANVAVACFGGFYATGAVARTLTNLRSGARGPVAGMIHALIVFAFMVLIGPWAAHVPLAAFAGLLAIVAWNMADKEAMWQLIRHSRADAVVLLSTFLIVVFWDLTEGIIVGFALGGLVFIHRMSDSTTVEASTPMPVGDGSVAGDIVIYHLKGPWFFGAVARLGVLLDQIADHPKALAVECSAVPFIDSTGARSFELLARKVARKGGTLYLAGCRPDVRRMLATHGVAEPMVSFVADLAAVARAEALRTQAADGR